MLYFSSTNLPMSSLHFIVSVYSYKPIISACHSDKSCFQVCRNRPLYYSKESKIDSNNVSWIGLNIQFAGLKSSLYWISFVLSIDMYALLEITLDGIEDWLALTQYLFPITCPSSKTTLTTPGVKLIRHSADFFNEEVINVWETESLDFELRAESSELFDSAA